jgi:hypothetical protein
MRRLRGLEFAAWLALSAGSAACGSSETERPAAIDPCGATPDDCIRPPVGGGSDVADAGGGSSGADAALSGSLSGDLLLLTDFAVGAAAPYLGVTTVRALGAAGSVVSGRFDSGSYELSELLVASANWIGVDPDFGADDAMATVQPVATTAVTAADLYLARSSAVDLVFNLAQQPVARQANMGHVAVYVVDAALKGLVDVTVSARGVELVAYFDGGTWTSNAERTGLAGLAFLGNLPASAFPGTTTTLTFSGAATGAVPVQVVVNAVTIVQISL